MNDTGAIFRGIRNIVVFCNVGSDSFRKYQDTGRIFRGEQTKDGLDYNIGLSRGTIQYIRNKEVLNMSECTEKWSIGDRIEGVCQCTPSKKVILEVDNIEAEWIWFRDVAKKYPDAMGNTIECGFFNNIPFTQDNIRKIFINGYDKYTYRRLPKEDVWRVGDILRGNCKCDSSKIIDFEYLGEGEFVCTKSSEWLGVRQFSVSTGCAEDVAKIFSDDILRDYTNWRRVPKYNTFWTKEREDSVNLHGSSSLDASRIQAGSVSSKTPVNYEFGDTIKVRGFEYEIVQPEHHTGVYLIKKEPPKPRCFACGREYCE